MKVSSLKQDGDWRFGRGKNHYVKRSDWVRQKLITRLRSHQQDWFLDTEHGLPWFDLVGERGTREQLTAEIERVTLDTDGVMSVLALETSVEDREYTARVKVRDVYNATIEVQV